MRVRTLSGLGRTLDTGLDIYFSLLSSGANVYSAPPPEGTGAKMCSSPPAFGAWRIEGTGERSSGRLSHQIARPFLCDSTSSGCSARYLRMNFLMSDSYTSALLQ